MLRSSKGSIWSELVLKTLFELGKAALGQVGPFYFCWIFLIMVNLRSDTTGPINSLKLDNHVNYFGIQESQYKRYRLCLWSYAISCGFISKLTSRFVY